MKGRLHRLERDGRRQCVDSNAAARPVPADVRIVRWRDRVHFGDLRFRRSRCRRKASEGSFRKRAVAVRELPRDRQEGHGPQLATPKIDVDPETYEVRADGELADLRTGDGHCRWRNDIFCFKEDRDVEEHASAFEWVSPGQWVAAKQRWWTV